MIFYLNNLVWEFSLDVEPEFRWNHLFLQSSNICCYITICKIDSQWKFAVWLRKLKQGLCINLEGWDGVGDGREVQKGEDICIPMADSC